MRGKNQPSGKGFALHFDVFCLSRLSLRLCALAPLRYDFCLAVSPIKHGGGHQEGEHGDPETDLCRGEPPGDARAEISAQNRGDHHDGGLGPPDLAGYDETNHRGRIHRTDQQRLGCIQGVDVDQEKEAPDGECHDADRASEEAALLGLSSQPLKAFALDYVKTHKK